ncbi:MAG: cache domain-containing protein [Thiotrichales bacterium]|nr:cache domain-containing protein [Thiotrichales bacterium]
MLRPFSLITLLAVAPMLFIPASVGFIAMMAIQSEKVVFAKTIKQIEQQSIESKVAAMRSKVDSIVDLAAYRKSVIQFDLHQRLKQRVEQACDIAHNIYNQFSDELSEAEVQHIIKAAIRPHSWNNGESFIWILDYDGVFHLAPEYLRHLEGSSIIDFKDAEGREVIKEEIEIVTGFGEGYLWDTFTKPGEPSGQQYKQLAFVKRFGHYNWYMGTGEYLDTAVQGMNQSLLDEISKIDTGNYDQLFVLDTQGTILLSSSSPELIGKNLSTEDALNATKKPTKAFKYEWLDSISRSDAKHIYVKNVPNTDWIIGGMLYDADVKSGISQTLTTLTDQYEMRISNMKSVSVLSFVIAIILSLFLSVSVHRRLVSFRNQLALKNHELEHLNVTLEEKVIERTQALEQANAQLERVATTDSLTNIQNRYAFMNVIRLEVHRSDRYHSQFSLIMFDIDYFKNVNDNFGHDVGDCVLVKLTELISSGLRDVDYFCRFGGEEFVILMPYTPLEAASETAERLRCLVAEHTFEAIEHLTISLGVVEHIQGETVEMVLKRADLALYESKEKGRNTVTTIQAASSSE